LKEEAYFDKVADPAAGSYYIETLTNLIAENSWKLFLEIEEKGGFLACLKSGDIQKKLSESAEKREKDIASRKAILLGTNQYPNTQEKISESVDLKKVFREKAVIRDQIIEPVNRLRGSLRYDELRIAVDKAARRPVVFLLPIGNPAMRKARAQFSANFFGCAGYEIIENTGFDNTDEAVRKALESKADIVVICSSDDDYLLFAPDIYAKLKDKAIIVVAGNPSSIDELKSKGLDNYIHVRSNIIEILAGFNEKLGIK
jgi:methylmalonyl-CoA mutase